jgi:hypothetical protein
MLGGPAATLGPAQRISTPQESDKNCLEHGGRGICRGRDFASIPVEPKLNGIASDRVARHAGRESGETKWREIPRRDGARSRLSAEIV